MIDYKNITCLVDGKIDAKKFFSECKNFEIDWMIDQSKLEQNNLIDGKLVLHGEKIIDLPSLALSDEPEKLARALKRSLIDGMAEIEVYSSKHQDFKYTILEGEVYKAHRIWSKPEKVSLE